MRWEGREQSTNVEDRRGMAMKAGGLVAGGGVGTIVLMIIMMFLGGNPQQLLEQVGEQQEQFSRAKMAPGNDPDASLMEFVSVVMKDNEDVWAKLFRDELGTRYREPKLVVFSGEVNSACGQATAQVGPFYCPGDSNVYLDFDFFRELRTRFHAPGDFAMAYVIAHEVGHHVQNQLGLSSKIQAMQNRAGKVESNELSVRLELQADYLAGVWAHHAQASKHILEAGDVASAMTAANQIGDDKLTQGRVRKENFTHGTSQQRVKWYSAGLSSGDVKGMMKLFELDFDKL
jgi:uncharacterized protein